jgi:hypothetical protein
LPCGICLYGRFNDFARHQRIVIWVFLTFLSLIIVPIEVWLLISLTHIQPSLPRFASGDVQKIDGVTGPPKADLDTSAVTNVLQSHIIKVEPGRTDLPLKVRYIWTPPEFAIALPEEAAAFLSGSGGKNMKIRGVPACPKTLEVRGDEIGSCSHSDANGRFTFVWDVSGLTDAQDVSLTIRLGATAPVGNFKEQFCSRRGDTGVCGDKKKSNVIGPGDSASILYGEETVVADRGHIATSKDGVLTVDAANGIVTSRNASRLPASQRSRSLSWVWLSA